MKYVLYGAVLGLGLLIFSAVIGIYSFNKTRNEVEILEQKALFYEEMYKRCAKDSTEIFIYHDKK